jgi:hypothetical protein
MKKLVLIAAVTIASASAFASKARVDALQNAAHMADTTDVLTKPDQAAVLPEFALVNFGATNAAGTAANAEGGFIRKMDGAAWGMYLGNRPGTNYRGLFNTANKIQAATTLRFLQMENGLNVLYAGDAGDMKWGAGLYYSSSSKKGADTVNVLKDFKQEAASLYLSASSTAGWDAQLAVGLMGKATYSTLAASANDFELKNNSTASLSGGYMMDTMYFYGSYGMSGAKVSQSVGAVKDLADRKDSLLKVGVVNSHKKDGTDFFYGVALQMETQKDETENAKNTLSSIGTTASDRITKREETSLPAIIGVEHDAMSWLVIRGSVTQNVLYSQQKNASDLTTADNGKSVDATNTVDANTTVAAGVGLKFNKFLLDGTLAQASNTGAFGSDANFLAKAALTYSF